MTMYFVLHWDSVYFLGIHGIHGIHSCVFHFVFREGSHKNTKTCIPGSPCIRVLGARVRLYRIKLDQYPIVTDPDRLGRREGGTASDVRSPFAKIGDMDVVCW